MKTIMTLLGCVAICFFAVATVQADVIAGPITNPQNGHDYYLLSPATWTASEAEAESLGGTLAIIKNASDQDWVFSTFSSWVNHNGLWIGLHRTRPGGAFSWVTGAPTNYFNWGTGEPNNAGGVENCVQMQNELSDTGAWNDLPDDHLLNGIVELPGKAHKRSLSKSQRALIGNWYDGGNIKRPCWITATDTELFMISSDRIASRLTVRADGKLFVPDYQGQRNGIVEFGYPPRFRSPNAQTGLSGEVIQDKILWSDGTWWSREPLKDNEAKSSTGFSFSHR